MLQQLARLIIAVAVCVFTTGVAQAVSLGKIEVTSSLGEPFYAEVPLAIDAGESLSAVSVSIASVVDYRILEVYRDAALNDFRADVEKDSRGTRVKLTSKGSVDAPFFNLVLKIEYNHATHFKKFPIFLDLPRAATAPAVSKALPTVKAIEGIAPAVTATPTYVAPTTSLPSESATAASEQQAATTTGFRPYDGWARIGRYGPMVYGDTITTVADRLRVDDRFTRQQVMVALFEKNRSKFDQDNINLIKAGTYLDVPSAAEVERVTSSQAGQLIAEHEKRWKQLTRQPRYAAVEEAQRTRYSKRIRIGEEASGAAAAPMGSAADEKSQPADEKNGASGSALGGSTAASAAMGQANAQIEELNRQNEELQAKLAESEKTISELQASKEAAPQAEAATAAQEQTRKKLELQVARLQAELDAARDQARAPKSSEAGMGWLTWVLGGVVVVLLGAVAFLLRREPKHPAMNAEEEASMGGFDRSSFAAAMPEAQEQEVEEIEVEEADVEAASGGEDFGGFDEAEDFGGFGEAEDFGEATMRISPEDAANFSDSIPDLTDEDTSEMEAFQEEVEEEPDPNVDYLSEADVYLRYGMEDEAMQQVRMALKQDATNPEAYSKMAQIQRQMGDQQGVEETIATASSALAGDALEKFSAAMSELQAGEVETESVSLEDTLPPTEVSELIGEDADQSAGEAGVELDSTMSELEGIDFGEAEESIEAASFEAEEAEAPEVTADVDLAFDLSEEESAESEEAAPAGQTDLGGGLDFDLSGFEMPESEEREEPVAEQQMATTDLPETVAIDWSQDTSVDSGEMTVSGESGAESMFEESPAEAVEAAPKEAAAESLDIGGLDFDFDTFGEEEAPKEEVSPQGTEPEAASVSTDDDVTTLDLGENDLDAGELSEIEVEPADDFTSTIQTSTLETLAPSDTDFTATGEHDLHMIEEATGGSDAEADAGLLDFDFGSGDDSDATQQLENLLSEFSDEDDKKKD